MNEIRHNIITLYKIQFISALLYWRRLNMYDTYLLLSRLYRK